MYTTYITFDDDDDDDAYQHMHTCITAYRMYADTAVYNVWIAKLGFLI